MPQCRQKVWIRIRKKEFRANGRRQICSRIGKLQILRARIDEIHASLAARLTVFREHMSILGPCARMSTRFSRFLSEHPRASKIRRDTVFARAYLCRCVSPDIWLRRTVVLHDTTPIGNNIHTGLDKSY